LKKICVSILTFDGLKYQLSLDTKFLSTPGKIELFGEVVVKHLAQDSGRGVYGISPISHAKVICL
jgi:hypothetical protein